jgi:hypothetical protein
MRDFDIEKLILDQFKKLIRLQRANQRRDQLMEFREKLHELAVSEECRALLRYFDFIGWTESKLQQTTLEEVLKKY